MKRSELKIIFFSLLFVQATVLSQSSLNPDISIIPRFRVESNDAANLLEKREFSRPEFTLEEFEVALQAYLNPYARADIFLSKPGFGDEPIEIEEAYATILRGLPLDLNVRAGKYLAEFGKLNTLHPHAWPFLDKPLSLERFLGEEGLNDLGISVSFLLPTGDLYTKLTVDVLRGNSIPGGAGFDLPDDVKPYYANSARLMAFFPVGENSDLEAGISGLTGIHNAEARHRFYYGNLDFKYKWKPDAYTSFTLQGEALLNSRKILSDDGIGTESLTSSGLYVFGDYQFLKSFTLGALYDWTQSPYSKEDKAQGVAFFAGFYPVEETIALRFQYKHTRFETPGGEPISVNSVALQFIFSMGPHKAHPF